MKKKKISTRYKEKNKGGGIKWQRWRCTFWLTNGLAQMHSPSPKLATKETGQEKEELEERKSKRNVDSKTHKKKSRRLSTPWINKPREKEGASPTLFYPLHRLTLIRNSRRWLVCAYSVPIGLFTFTTTITTTSADGQTKETARPAWSSHCIFPFGDEFHPSLKEKDMDLINVYTQPAGKSTTKQWGYT